MTTGKTIALIRQTFVGKVMSLLFSILSRLVIAILPRSKHLLISWLQSPSAVILEPKNIKSLTVSIVSLSICHEVMGPDAMILVLWMLSFKPTFSLSSFTFIKRLFSSFSLSAMRVVSAAAAAKSLQCCPTQCDPIGGSLPDSSVPGTLQARTLEWVAIAFASAYLRLLIFLPEISIPACASSSPAFHMMYSVYKLNKQGDNI